MGKKVKLSKNEAGYALVWVLILMIVSGLILMPLLLLMTTGIMSSQLHEERMQRFYAADAGIEDGMYNIINDIGLPANIGEQSSYTLDQELNNSTLDVTIYKADADTYRITSTATDNDNGKSTTIESYVSHNEYSLFDNVITSRGDIRIQPGATVEGTVQYNPDPEVFDPGDVSLDQFVEAEVAGWPTAEELSSRYWEDVALCEEGGEAVVCEEDNYLSDNMDIKDLVPREIGPLYRDGDLHIFSSEWDLEVTLTETIYVTGDLTIGQTNKDFTLHLGANTIYAEGSIRVTDKVTISGSGCFVIAVGDVFFGPKMQSSEGDFAFVMSVAGEVQFQPLGDFHGALAGDLNVQLQPNCTLDHTDPPEGGLNFPDVLARAVSTINTYNIVD